MKSDYVNRHGQMTCGECNEPLRAASDSEELSKAILQACVTPGCRNNPKSKQFSVWSIPRSEDDRRPQFFGDAADRSGAFKLKASMEKLGATHVKVIENETGKEITPSPEEIPSF